MLELHFEEISWDSRKFTVSRKNVSKEFVFVVSSPDFVSEADEYPLPGTDLTMLGDDKLVQQQVLPLFNGIAPLMYEFWFDEEHSIMLYAAETSVTQINFQTWEIKITYDIPEDNGSNSGGGQNNGDTGPSDGEKNSEQFTQLAFNFSTGTEKIQIAKTNSVHKNTSRDVSEPVHFNIGGYNLIGASDEGVEGAEVYTRQFKFTITQYMPPTKLTYSYVRRLRNLGTCLNSKPFFGFPPGSVMLVGASGEGSIYENVPVSLEFEVRPNFKIIQGTGDPIAAPPDDEVEYNDDGSKRIKVYQQYDIFYESMFPSTEKVSNVGGSPDDYYNPYIKAAIIAEGGTEAQAKGIHSGWDILSYLYKQKVNTSSKNVIREPSHRAIYEYYIYQDFEKLEL